jgi:hypothetical protein
MARDWENSFASWAQGPGKTEDAKSENAVRAIRSALEKSESLANRNFNVILQGSYKNRVNVRQNSDVDVGIVCHSTFFYGLPDGYTATQFGITPATYHYHQFKNDVARALVTHFGDSAVHRGNKAFDIKENSYRVEADVAAFFDYRVYSANGSYLEGVQLQPDNGGQIINWPEQHYSSAVSMNTATRRRYKRLVRIVKRLCIEMAENGVGAASAIPGFLIECLIWNVPNEHFAHSTYRGDVRAVLAHLFNNTRSSEQCAEWLEVSELKYLFDGAQLWTWQQAHAFIDAAWDYIGLE